MFLDYLPFQKCIYQELGIYFISSAAYLLSSYCLLKPSLLDLLSHYLFEDLLR